MKRHKRLLIGLVVLAVAAGTGIFAYLEATRLDRLLDSLYAGADADDFAYLADHAEDPRVLDALVEEVQYRAGPDEIWGDQREQMLEAARAFASHPPQLDPYLLRAAILVRIKFDVPEMLEWIPQADRDAQIGDALYALLQGLGEDPESWPTSRQQDVTWAEQALGGVLRELEVRGLTDRTRVDHAMVPISLRYDFAAESAQTDLVATYFKDAFANPDAYDAQELFLGEPGKRLRDARDGGRNAYLEILVACSQGHGDIATRCFEATVALGPQASDDLLALADASDDGVFQEAAIALAERLGDTSAAVQSIAYRVEQRLPPRPWDRLDLLPPYSNKLGPPKAPLMIKLADPIAELTALGPDAAPTVLALAFGNENSPASTGEFWSMKREALIATATHAGAALDPALMGRMVADRFANFDAQALELEAKRSVNDPIPDEDVQRFLSEATLLFWSLQALKEAPPNQAVDFAFLEALSCPVERFSQFASQTLRERMDGVSFADALFAFLAQKTEYSRYEISIYRDSLTGYDAIAPGIAHNLEDLLKRGDGRPESVFWAYKLIGLEALAQVGTRDQLAMLQTFAEDQSSYLDVTTNADTGTVIEETEKPFADLARIAITEIENR